MKPSKNMALSTDFEPTKPSSWHFGKQPDRYGWIKHPIRKQLHTIIHEESDQRKTPNEHCPAPEHK